MIIADLDTQGLVVFCSMNVWDMRRWNGFITPAASGIQAPDSKGVAAPV